MSGYMLPTCKRCGVEYDPRDESDEGRYCDICAQTRVSELEPMLKKLRDFIEFGPFYGIEATNIVIEADKILKEPD
jgi:hypothetical protein